MRPTPEGWPRISAGIFYDKPSEAIDWLCKAFGFEVRLKIEGDGGSIVHSELTFGTDGLVMVGDAGAKEHLVSPNSAGGKNTQSLMIYVDDCDASCERARKAGGQITLEPKTSDYGEAYWADRSCQVVDPEGHRWWLVQRMSTGGKTHG
jgi:uncharacterized glyoxalase superfamily protein PhnB